MSILLALWEASEPFAEEDAVPFSELRDRVGISDSGQFNYHLDKLAGHFLEKTDDGYELRDAGHQLIGRVIAGTGLEEPSLEPTVIDKSCSRCGPPTAITHKDRSLYIPCTECEGNWEPEESQPSGMLAGGTFDPAGLTDRPPERIWDVMLTTLRHADQSAVEGVCHVCSGPMDISLDICDEHASEGVCDYCGREWAIAARFRCPVCKNALTGPTYWTVARHPAVIGFFYERGVSMEYDSDDLDTIGGLVGDYDQEIVSDDPPRVRVTYEYEGDRLEVLVDEELNVLEVTEPD